MLQAAKTDLFNPLVPKAPNSECQNLTASSEKMYWVKLIEHYQTFRISDDNKYDKLSTAQLSVFCTTKETAYPDFSESELNPLVSRVQKIKSANWF